MGANRNGRKRDQNVIGGSRKEAWEIPYDREEDEEGFYREEQEEQDKSGPPGEGEQDEFEEELTLQPETPSLAVVEEEWEAGKYLSYQTESREDEFGELEHHIGDSDNED